MSTVASQWTWGNDRQAQTLADILPLSGIDLPVLVVLVAAALVLGRALLAVVATALALLAPAFALLRSLLVVIGLIVLLVLGTADASDSAGLSDLGPTPTGVEPRPAGPER